MSYPKETILYINLRRLEENFNFFKKSYDKNNKIIAVVKAFAYGLGDFEIAKKLEKLGVDGFWVADFEEGIHLRKYGITKPIIVANPGFKSKSLVLEYDLEPVIYSLRMLDLYCLANKEVNVHLKFNTGMNRYGFSTDDMDDIIEIVKSNHQIKIKSICSHLASSNDERQDLFSKQQIDQLEKIQHRFEHAFGTTIPKHILNSYGALRFKPDNNDWIRLGIALYGGINHPKLKQIFTLKSVINQIRKVKAGEYIGYQHSFKSPISMRMAVIPVGYADGLNRNLGHSKGKVIIKNRSCPILGEISMDSMIVDVSDTTAKEGDEVIIFNPKHSVVNLSNRLNTIPYEIMATINRRIKRVYLNE